MPQIKIISPVQNINDAPEVAEIVKLVTEDIRSKPSPKSKISVYTDLTDISSNLNIASRIKEFLKEG